ncbi:hypothetical protein DW1_2240 [Proteiniborus sp. DW1]|uniref:DUF4956 domain-containing protein n=1 Tax=Proteiniborus sp. DW1 TaxID=1889883 RepID=UPI00092E1CBE|nr:DUF4956 domain-containing protein [Proteiniborus sp. DW1]SCG83804.1 hypothetical protein DW1_2240 [Proteiniborus sp. DW1]
MREFIIENLSNAETISIATIVLNNIVAIMAAFFLMFVYRMTYSGTAYSRKFNVSLGAITIITTMIMSVISNNVALSLGMVGALSIIRFRTAVKDVRDATFIFWSIAVGIGCGVSQYSLIGIGSVFLFLFFLLTKQAVMDQRQLLIIQGTIDSQNQIEAVVESHFGKGVHQTMKNVSEDGCELIYSVKENVLTKANEENLIDISQRLMRIEGVKRVNLVEQLDDISR